MTLRGQTCEYWNKQCRSGKVNWWDQKTDVGGLSNGSRSDQTWWDCGCNLSWGQEGLRIGRMLGERGDDGPWLWSAAFQSLAIYKWARDDWWEDEKKVETFVFCNSRKRNSWKCMWDEEKVGTITICKLIKKQNSFGSRLAQVWILASCLCDFRQCLALCLLHISCYCLNVNF